MGDMNVFTKCYENPSTLLALLKTHFRIPISSTVACYFYMTNDKYFSLFNTATREAMHHLPVLCKRAQWQLLFYSDMATSYTFDFIAEMFYWI